MPRNFKRSKPSRKIRTRHAWSKKRVRDIPKRNLVRARTGIVETKKRTFEPPPPFVATELLGEHNIMIPNAWEKHNQGVSDDDIIGTSIFMKYLTAKFYFNMNVGAIKQVAYPLDMRVIIGWCKLPQNIPQQDVAVTGPPAKVKGVVYNYNPEAHILGYIKASMDNPLESMDREIFKIDKDYVVRGQPVTAHDNALGHDVYIRKNFFIEHTWRPLRKLKLELVTSAASGNGTHWSPCNKSGQWIPFVYIYNMNHGTFPTGSCPTYLKKSVAYFTDS